MNFVCKCSVPRSTIRETLYDSAKNEYMTESEITVINFDRKTRHKPIALAMWI